VLRCVALRCVVRYPDLFLDFIKELEMIREDKLTPQGNNVALLTTTSDTLVAGSQERTPEGLWDHVLDKAQSQMDSAETNANTAGGVAGIGGRETRVVLSLVGQVRRLLGGDGTSVLPGRTTALSSTRALRESHGFKNLDETHHMALKKVEVSALRVPFDGAVKTTHSGLCAIVVVWPCFDLFIIA
jgi:hypothetical protein